MEDTKLCTRPLFFERNRVSRVYRGGLLFHDFFGDEPKDSRKPEEWVGSLVRAMDKEDGEGQSVVRGENVSFAELAARRPELLFGENNRFDVLVKVLDSAERLPVQTHPDRAFSEKYLNSTFGKTEMWLILKTRPEACIYLGFGRKISKERFSELAEQTKTAPDAMLPYLNRVEVREGDVYLIPARTVHAIGAGCLILEVQEPTDFTIQPEYWCGDYLLNEREMYLGLQKDEALDCFDFGSCGTDVVLRAKKRPKIIRKTNAALWESLIGEKDTPCFSVERLSITRGKETLGRAPALCVVLEGEGMIQGENYGEQLKRGDYFFLPACAASKFFISSESSIQIAVCKN